MSIASLKWASEQRTGNPIDKHILEVLGDWSNHHGRAHEVCWHSQQSIAERCECSTDTVRRSLGRLEANGFIKRTPRFATDGSRTSDLIELLLDRPAMALAPKNGLAQGPGKMQGGSPQNAGGALATAAVPPGNLQGGPLQDAGVTQSEPKREPKEESSARASESSDAVAPDLELIADAPRQDKPAKSRYTQEFEGFWARCPQHSKRGSKSDAFKAWRGLNGCRPLALEAVDAWNRAEAARLAKSKEPDAERTVPHVATWLRGRRWETLAEVKQDRAAKAAHAKTFAYPLAQDPLEEQLRILRRWQECSSEGRHTGWTAAFGPEPGHPDCKIPAELLARAGISVDKLNGHDTENHAMLQPAS